MSSRNKVRGEKQSHFQIGNNNVAITIEAGAQVTVPQPPVHLHNHTCLSSSRLASMLETANTSLRKTLRRMLRTLEKKMSAKEWDRTLDFFVDRYLHGKTRKGYDVNSISRWDLREQIHLLDVTWYHADVNKRLHLDTSTLFSLRKILTFNNERIAHKDKPWTNEKIMSYLDDISSLCDGALKRWAQPSRRKPDSEKDGTRKLMNERLLTKKIRNETRALIDKRIAQGWKVTDLRKETVLSNVEMQSSESSALPTREHTAQPATASMDSHKRHSSSKHESRGPEAKEVYSYRPRYRRGSRSGKRARDKEESDYHYNKKPRYERG